jgi:CheY-like chemotaxis protein
MKESVLLRGRKLLLADDSIAIRKVIELTFEDEGMQVVSVGDGRQAVERLEELRPDVVLADVYMPELTGYQVCEQIKRDERFQHIPVILLVGSFEPFNEAEARRVGADDYLTKPFQSIRQMVSKVGALLSGNKSEAEASTQKLPAQTEQSKTEGRERMEKLELTTADTAPLPPHMRLEAEADHDARAKGPFADLQLDDEMIEETRTSDYDSAGRTMTESHQRPTEPLTTQDLRDVGLKPSAASTGQQLASSGAGVWTDESRGTSAREQSPAQTQSAARGNTGDDALLDLDDVEMPRSSAMAEADDFILDLQDASEAHPKAVNAPEVASSSFETARPSASFDETTIEAELMQEMTEAAPQAAQFTDAQFANEEQRAEFSSAEERSAPAGEFHLYQQSAAATASPATEVEPERQATDSSQMHETEELQSRPSTAQADVLTESFDYQAPPARAEEEATQAASPALETQAAEPGQIGLEQLSPAAIDAIARRVVEQLSAKVVEQIAWEVVPPLAELLIKRRLEEDRSRNR